MASTTPRRRRTVNPPDYVPARRSAGDSPTITPDMIVQRLLDFLRRRGWIAIPLALLAGALLGTLAWYYLPLVYTARRDVSLSPPNADRLAEFKQTQIEKLISPVVCKIAVNLPQARSLPFVQSSADPAEVLAKMIQVESDPLAQSFSVTASDTDPKVAQSIVNCAVDAYLQFAQDEKSAEIASDVKATEAERDENLKAIERIKDQQIELARQAGYGDPQSLRKQIDQLESERREREKERDRVEFDRMDASKALELANASSIELTPEQEQSLNSGGGGDQTLEKALSVMESQAEEIRRNSVNGEQDPDFIRAKQYIARQRANMGGGKEGMRERYRQSNAKKKDESIRTLEGKIVSSQQQEKILSQRISALSATIVKLQAVAQDIERSRLDLESKERSVDAANNRLADLRRNARDTNVYSPIEADEPKIPKSSSKRLMAIFGGAAGGFFAILVLFALADFQVNLITRPDHLEKTQPLPVLGVLPRLPEGKRIPTDNDFLPGAKYRSVWLAMNEAINSLRITLTFAPDRHNDGMSSLMVTSPRDAEGKSTFVAHMAISMARTGVKVVIVEADLHRPTQYETFGVSRDPGLSDVLHGKVTVQDVLKETMYPGLYVLPAGTPVDERTPTLLPERVKQVFADLREMFQMIIVDAPPVLPVYDALVFGQNVDETILLVRCDHSRFQTIGQTQSRLESVGIPIAGLVVCGSKSATRYGYYYDGYASYRSNGSANGKHKSNGIAKKTNDSESTKA